MTNFDSKRVEGPYPVIRWTDDSRKRVKHIEFIDLVDDKNLLISPQIILDMLQFLGRYEEAINESATAERQQGVKPWIKNLVMSAKSSGVKP